MAYCSLLKAVYMIPLVIENNRLQYMYINSMYMNIYIYMPTNQGSELKIHSTF